MSTGIVHVRRTIVVEYDVDRADYETWDDDTDSPRPLTDAEVIGQETEPHGRRDGWSINDLDDDQITASSAEVTFR